MESHFDSLENRSRDEREAALMAAVARQIEHVRSELPLLAGLYAGCPGPVDSREKLAKLPLLKKSELVGLQRQNRPFGGLATISTPELVNIFASPGPIYEPGGRRDDFWRMARALHAAGFRPGDLVHNCFSYHFTPAGAMLEAGARRLGCAVVPAGVGNTEIQVQTIADLAPAGYVGTPSFLKIILEKGDELGADLSSLKKALVTGEALPNSLRDWFAGRGIRVLQCYATADLGLIAYETSAREGMLIDEGIVVEIVRPGTGDPVGAGEVGEVVVTLLDPEYPLVRFATGDLSAILPGSSPCGRTNDRLRGWMGRADQTTKVRGMFVRPEQVAAILARHPAVIKGRLVVDRVEDQDCMTLHCEFAGSPQDGLAASLVDGIRDITKLRGEIQLVGPGELPNDGKVIDDRRPVD